MKIRLYTYFLIAFVFLSCQNDDLNKTEIIIAHKIEIGYLKRNATFSFIITYFILILQFCDRFIIYN